MLLAFSIKKDNFGFLIFIGYNHHYYVVNHHIVSVLQHLENYERIASCKMKGSFEKFHDWLYKWLFERNKKIQVKFDYDLPMDPKQQVWTTVKENENRSKIRFKHKVTEKTHTSCGNCCLTCFILMVMASMAIILSTQFLNDPLVKKTAGARMSLSIVLYTLLLNEGIPRAYRGKKLRLKNILLLPFIFEEMNSFQSFKSEGRIQLEGNFQNIAI